MRQVLLVMALIVIVGLYFIGYIQGYREGQIAVQTGTVQYCLEAQPDLTLVWVYKQEGCEAVKGDGR